MHILGMKNLIHHKLSIFVILVIEQIHRVPFFIFPHYTHFVKDKVRYLSQTIYRIRVKNPKFF